jgi:hypothetical protein
MLLSVDFTALTPGGLATLPGGLSFARADSSTCATVQTSATTNSGTIAANVARIGNDGTRSGLKIEPARTNLVPDSRNMSAASWSAGTNTTLQSSNNVGPDGAATAFRYTSLSGGNSPYRTSSPGAGKLTSSSWQRGHAGGEAYAAVLALGATAAAADFAYMTGTLTTAWRRISGTPTNANGAGTAIYHIPSDGVNRAALSGPAAAARDAIMDMHQVEQGAWASEFISTSGGTATRAGERVYVASAGAYVVAGRLAMDETFYPSCTPALADGAMRFWTSGSDYAEISTGGTLTVSIGGSTNTCAVNWALGDLVEIYIAAGGSRATVVSLRINGGAVSFPAITGSALGNVSTAGALDFFCNGTSNQLAGWHRYLHVYR